MIRKVAPLVICAVLLALLWGFIPAQLGRAGGADAPPITIRAADSATLVWFAVACFATALILVYLGWFASRLATRRSRLIAALLREYLPDGLVLCDKTGKVQWSNETARTLVFDNGLLRSEAQTVVMRAASIGKTALQGVAIGERTRLTLQAIPLRDHNIALIVRQVQNEGAQAQFYERFMQRIVHDMRNPLAAIIAHAGNLRADPTPDAHPAQIIEREALRLTRLVDSLLFDARLTYVPLHTERLDLAALLQDVVYQFEERAAEEGKTLVLELPAQPAKPITAELDHDLLVRAIGNLIDNSLKYSDEGCTVRLVLDSSPAELRIEVVDDGDGIPPEYLPDRIFEPLVRARTRDRGSGTGLGLAIVKKVVELHGGRVTAERNAGKGTRIGLWLPN
jgi:signal transduction histidine kinase